jgi:hypothetical protein
LQGKIAIPTQMLLASPRESAISVPPFAESSNNSGFLLNGHGQMPRESLMFRGVSPDIGAIRP